MMKKKLRFLGLATVIGATAIVTAQQSGGRAKTQGDPSFQGQSAPGAVATAANGWISSNEVTALMIQAFSSRQQYEIEAAQIAGRNDRVQPIIHVNCAAMLTLMTSEQRERVIKTWELDRYAPNDPGWAKVVKAPQLAKHLLTVNQKARDAAAKVTDDAWSSVRKYTDEMNARLFQTPEWKAAKTKHEQNLVSYAFYQKYGTKTPLIDRKKASVGRYDKAMKTVRAALNAAEGAEFDKIVARFETSMKAAVAGRAIAP